MIIMVPDPLGPALSLVIKSGTALSKMEISYMTALKGQDLDFFYVPIRTYILLKGRIGSLIRVLIQPFKNP